MICQVYSSIGMVWHVHHCEERPTAVTDEVDSLDYQEDEEDACQAKRESYTHSR